MIAARQKKTASPEWDDRLSLSVSDSTTLNLKLLSKSLLTDTTLGTAKLKMSTVQKTPNGECKLLDSVGEKISFLKMQIGSL